MGDVQRRGLGGLISIAVSLVPVGVICSLLRVVRISVIAVVFLVSIGVICSLLRVVRISVTVGFGCLRIVCIVGFRIVFIDFVVGFI